jgi:hypothetical protein
VLAHTIDAVNDAQAGSIVTGCRVLVLCEGEAVRTVVRYVILGKVGARVLVDAGDVGALAKAARRALVVAFGLAVAADRTRRDVALAGI